MKRLIVNADDVGADEARNSGIFEAIASGSITSVSILPNGPALEDAVSRIRSLDPANFSFGVHLNLSEGRPLSAGLKRIVGPDGFFLGKTAARRLFMFRADRQMENEIRTELSAQIQLVRDAGIPVDHIDGHQHVHVFPAVVLLAAETAKIFGISWTRVPEEEPGQTHPVSSALREEGEFFSRHARAARPVFAEAGISAPDSFRGLYMKGQLPASHWEEFFDTIPQGLTELMVHPGRAGGTAASGPFSGFSTADREKELQALMTENFRWALIKAGIELIPFPDRQHFRIPGE